MNTLIEQTKVTTIVIVFIYIEGILQKSRPIKNYKTPWQDILALNIHWVGENGRGTIILVCICWIKGTVYATHSSHPGFLQAASRVSLRDCRSEYAVELFLINFCFYLIERCWIPKSQLYPRCDEHYIVFQFEKKSQQTPRRSLAWNWWLWPSCYPIQSSFLALKHNCGPHTRWSSFGSQSIYIN